MRVATPSTFELALERFDLRAWCERSGFQPQGRIRKEWITDCPRCGEQEKFSINPDKRIWRCFVNSCRFRLFDLIAAFEGSYAKAMVVILESTAIGHSLAYISSLDLKQNATYLRDHSWQPLPIQPPAYFEPLLQHHPYTARRGFSLEGLVRLGVGICTWGRYQDRLVFPIKRPDGAWLYFQTRATWDKHEQKPDDDGVVRYRKNLNPAPESADYASASDVLMGLELARGYKRVAVVEGPTDLVQTGPAAVATLGKVVSDRHIQLLLDAGVEEIDLAYDPDAWLKPTRKLADGRVEVLKDKLPPAQLAAERFAAAFRAVRIVRYPPTTDPGSCTPDQNLRLRMDARPFGDGSRLQYLD